MDQVINECLSKPQSLDQLLDIKDDPNQAFLDSQQISPQLDQFSQEIIINSEINTRSSGRGRKKKCEEGLTLSDEKHKNLKIKVEKMEISTKNKTKNCLKQKNQMISQLKKENESLKTQIIIANKLTDVLTKYRTFITERLDLMTDSKIESLETEFKDVFQEKQTFDRNNTKTKREFKLKSNNKINQSMAKKSRSAGMRCSWPGCAYEAKRTKLLNEHMNAVHTGNRPYSCPMTDCNKSFARSTTLDVHIKSSHCSDKLFVCSWEGCQATLKTKLGLKIHLQAHSGDKKFACSWPGCGYKGLTKQQLDNHVRNHTGEKPFVCSWPGCESRFTTADGLRYHKKSHSNIRPFKCDWPGCDGAFKRNRALTVHKALHTGDKVFKCDWSGCQFRASRYHDLAVHKIMHTGEKKYRCSWPGCESRFLRNDKLKLHLMIHRGDKPHKCPFNGCDKRFVEKGNMRKHYNSVHSKPNL
ncbi:zinc finger protein 93-like [Oppia nitens]|uniref:zinc finger protein 93-like n=1 Tax=Oppia nitens TaxID=1686743 RepID=UPI0023DC8D04|nr:zinc finger protein 93-like [Oppia nitens]